MFSSTDELTSSLKPPEEHICIGDKRGQWGCLGKGWMTCGPWWDYSGRFSSCGTGTSEAGFTSSEEEASLSS